MNRLRLIRGLGIAWSLVCGVVSVLLIVLWVRSSDTMGYLAWSKTKFGWTIAVTSFDGECEFMFAT
jgi:hypothetical protein